MTQRADLQIVDDNNNPISVIVSDALGLILKSPGVTQAFLKAVTAVVVRYVGGIVTSVVIEIGAIHKQIQIETYRQQVTIRISKLEVATEECAKALARAEAANWPQDMKQEFADRLYGLFYEEMARIAPRRI